MKKNNKKNADFAKNISGKIISHLGRLISLLKSRKGGLSGQNVNDQLSRQQTA